MRLTDLTIKRLPFEEKQRRYWDAGLPGFGVTVGKQTKTFIVMYGTARKLKTLGRYPDKTLADARKQAKRYLARNHAENASVSYPEAVEGYLDEAASRLRPKTLSFYKLFLSKLDYRGEVRDIRRPDLVPHIQSPHC